MEMYVAIKRILVGWQVYRRREQAEEYFNVTAAQFPSAAASKCTSFAFTTSRNGRHTLTVRSADWVVTNVHVETGPSRVDRDERSQQLHHLNRPHENGADKLHLLRRLQLRAQSRISADGRKVGGSQGPQHQAARTGLGERATTERDMIESSYTIVTLPGAAAAT